MALQIVILSLYSLRVARIDQGYLHWAFVEMWFRMFFRRANIWVESEALTTVL